MTMLATPFRGGGVDERCFRDLVARQVAAGVGAVVVGSLTGEGPTLAAAERAWLVRIAVEVAGTRAIVLAATGTNCTQTTVALSRDAAEAGAGGLLVVAPYYSRPSQEGLFRHFEALARSVSLPVIVHNAPACAAVEIRPATIGRLAALPTVVGLLDDDEPALPLARLAAAEAGMSLFASDAAALRCAEGRGGLFSTLANVAPQAIRALWQARLAADVDLADELSGRFLPVAAALMAGPPAVKLALSLRRPEFGTEVRLPLTPLAGAEAEAVRLAMQNAADEPAGGLAQKACP